MLQKDILFYDNLLAPASIRDPNKRPIYIGNQVEC